MSGWISYLTGRGSGSKDSTREAIVNLREHLLMLDKKEEHLTKKIEEETRKAKANATTKPNGALRGSRAYEGPVDAESDDWP